MICKWLKTIAAMKSLKSLNENAYYTNYTILSHIKFFFTKFLYIKYCLYASIKILSPYKTCSKGF